MNILFCNNNKIIVFYIFSIKVLIILLNTLNCVCYIKIYLDFLNIYTNFAYNIIYILLHTILF